LCNHGPCAMRNKRVAPPVRVNYYATIRLQRDDRIEKRIELKAPVSRVWRALTDHREFGEWFGVKLDGTFTPGQASRGHITYPGYEHLKWEAIVQKMEPNGSSLSRGILTPWIPTLIIRKRHRRWLNSSWKRPPTAHCLSLSNPASTSFRPTAA